MTLKAINIKPMCITALNYKTINEQNEFNQNAFPHQKRHALRQWICCFRVLGAVRVIF